MGCLCNKPPPPKVYDPTPDPTTGLTMRDRDLIESSWQIIGNKNAIKTSAVEFFLMLFAAYPYIQNYFGLFKNKELSELRNSPKMRAHAASVFYFITSYVENLEDPETLVGLIEKMAVSHIGRGITVEEMEKLRITFNQFLQKTLGAKSSPEIEEAWDKLFRAQNAVFIMTAEEMSSEAEEASGFAESGSG